MPIRSTTFAITVLRRDDGSKMFDLNRLQYEITDGTWLGRALKVASDEVAAGAHR